MCHGLFAWVSGAVTTAAGGAAGVLSPAHVFLKSIGTECCVGNFGMDLYKQAPAMDIDFGTMKLQLVSTD
jgi:hypothetical protein